MKLFHGICVRGKAEGEWWGVREGKKVATRP